MLSVSYCFATIVLIYKFMANGMAAIQQ